MKLTAKEKKQLTAWDTVSERYEIDQSQSEQNIVKDLIREGLNVYTLQQEDKNKLSGELFDKAKDENPSMGLTKTTWVDLVKFKKNVDLGKTDEKEMNRLRNKINGSLYKAAVTTEQLNAILEGREQKLLIPNETAEIEDDQFEVDDSNPTFLKDIEEASVLKGRIDEDYKDSLKELRMAFAHITELDQYLYTTFVEIEYYKNGNPTGGSKKPILSKEVQLIRELLELMDRWDMSYLTTLLSRNGLKVSYTTEKHFASEDFRPEADKWLGVDARSPMDSVDNTSIKNWHVIVEFDGDIFLIDRISNEILDVLDPKIIPISGGWITDFTDFDISLSFYTEIEGGSKSERINNFMENFNKQNTHKYA